MKLKFLGTGGGRYATGKQLRKTGGIVVKTEETQIHVDPGPGALVESHEELENPEETELLVVSHGHPDHSSDAEPIIEMMTTCFEHPGTLFASESVLSGYGDIEKRVSDYHQNLCGKVKTLDEGAEFDFKDVSVESQQMFHSDPKTQGLFFETDKKKIGFWTDTEYSEELLEFYEGCDIMVVYCSRPRNKGISSHTSVDEVPELLNSIEPKTAILTHFGSTFLESDMESEKGWIEEKVDSKIILAEDGMEFPGNRSLGDF